MCLLLLLDAWIDIMNKTGSSRDMHMEKRVGGALRGTQRA
jgi:hypothetical protein